MVKGWHRESTRHSTAAKKGWMKAPKNKYYEGTYINKKGKTRRVIYAPKTGNYPTKQAWTVLGKKPKWFEQKRQAEKYATR